VIHTAFTVVPEGSINTGSNCTNPEGFPTPGACKNPFLRRNETPVESLIVRKITGMELIAVEVIVPVVRKPVFKLVSNPDIPVQGLSMGSKME
jgi:hypothetical protein